MELQALAAKLLLTASLLSGYPAPAEPPTVALASDARLRAIGCRGQCTATALYHPEHGVLLSDRLDPVRDPRARAVLLHEIVHHLQELGGAYADLPPCARFLAREREAYAVENRYLRRWGQPPSYGYALMVQSMDLSACADR